MEAIKNKIKSIFTLQIHQDDLIQFTILFLGFYLIMLSIIDNLFVILIFTLMILIHHGYDGHKSCNAMKVIFNHSIINDFRINENDVKRMTLTVLKNDFLNNFLQAIWPKYLSKYVENELKIMYSKETKNIYESKLMQRINVRSFTINIDYPPYLSDVHIEKNTIRADEIVLLANVRFSCNVILNLLNSNSNLLLKN